MSLTKEGYIRPTYSEILASRIQSAKDIFGDDIDVSSTSPLGKFIRIGAYDLSKAYEDIEAVYYARFPNTSTGTSLDRLCVFAGIHRNNATYAMLNIKVSGTANSTVDSLVVSGDDTDITYTNTQSITLDNTGKATAVFVCSERGSVGNITKIDNIVTPLANVTAVEYVSTYQYGEDIETDTALRKRFKLALQGAGGANTDGIRAEVLKVDGVKSVSVISNDTNSTVDGRPPHSYEVYVYGGESKSQEIANAIFINAPIGIQSCSTATGATPITVVDDSGVSHNVYYSRTVEIAIGVSVTYAHDSNFPSDGVQQIKNAVTNYINSLGVGDDVIKSAMYPYLMSITGVTDISNLTLYKSGGALPGNAGIESNQVAKAGTITVTASEDSATLDF